MTNNSSCSLVVVRLVEGNESVDVSVTWGEDIKLNFNRSKDEHLERLLARLRLNWEKAVKKLDGRGGKKSGKKRKQEKTHASTGADGEGDKSASVSPPGTVTEDLCSPVAVRFLGQDGVTIDGSLRCAEALSKAKHLEINGKTLPVLVNPPRVTKLCLPKKCLVGFPFPAQVHVESAPKSAFTFEWSYLSDSDSVPTALDRPSKEARRHVFIPTELDFGKRIALRVFHPDTPSLGLSASSPSFVERGPRAGWRERRVDSFAADRRPTSPARPVNGPRLRICSFNILADRFARTRYALTYMHPYCNMEALEIGYRQLLIGRELVDLQCDICCLQECTTSVFRSFLLPLFEGTHTGIHKVKVTKDLQKRFEGCAIFFNSKRLRLEEYRHGDLYSALLSDETLRPAVAQIFTKYPNFVSDILPKLGTIFQVCAFELRDCAPPASSNEEVKVRRFVVVGNTHLYFCNTGKHIRMLQVAALLAEANRVRQRLLSKHKGEVEVVMCGDFNTPPESGASELLHKGRVASTHADWLCASKFKWGKDEEETGEEEEQGDDEGGQEPEELTGEGEEDATKVGEKWEGGLHFDQTAAGRVIELLETLRRQGLDEKQGDKNGAGVELSWPAGLSLVDCHESQRLASPSTFTHKVLHFCDTLDYIFRTPGLEVVKVTPAMQLSWLKSTIGIPSVEYGSDHVAIAAEVAFLR